LARRAKGRFDRGMEAVSAARSRAMEIAQQCAALPRLTPTASHRRRLARLRASELWNAPTGCTESRRAFYWGFARASATLDQNALRSPELGRSPFWERPSRALPDPEESPDE